MAGEHLRVLTARYAPGVSVRELCRRTGYREHRLAYYLDDPEDGGAKRLPSIERCEELARIIGGGCTPGEVFQAIQQDLDPRAVLVDGLDDDERDLIADYRELSPTAQTYLRRIAAVMKA